MTDQIETVEEVPVVRRTPGQDIGNPMPPTIITVPHEGHKADSDSWTRTKKKSYLKKQARQRINNGSTDKKFFAIIAPRRQGG